MNVIDLSASVEAAARKAYEDDMEHSIACLPDDYRARLEPRYRIAWEDVHPATKLHWRNEVLPIVQAAVGALPDRDRGLWLEGYYAAESGIPEEACPYPLDTGNSEVWCANHGPGCPYGCIR